MNIRSVFWLASSPNHDARPVNRCSVRANRRYHRQSLASRRDNDEPSTWKEMSVETNGSDLDGVSREERRDEPPQYEGMRMKLINATLEVVGQVGLENLTIRKVSEHAGVSVGLAHHHFTNKDNLVYKTFLYMIRQVPYTVIENI